MLLTHSLRENYYYNRDLQGFYPDVQDSPNYFQKIHLEYFLKHYQNPQKIADSFAHLPSRADARIAEFFEGQKSTHAAIMLVSIKDFKQKCDRIRGKRLSAYLDKYYNTVIPIIYKHGGEIEKIIGDSLVVVFGLPFLRDYLDGLLIRADNCAKEIIYNLMGTNKEVKISLHDGKIMYYRNRLLDIPEYAVVGKPISDLFQLDAISEVNGINFFVNSSYDLNPNCQTGQYRIVFRRSHWEKMEGKPIYLEGVEYAKFAVLKCA